MTGRFPLGTLDLLAVSLYLTTAIWFAPLAGFDVFRSITVLPFAASSLFDVLALDLVGLLLVLRYRVGGAKSLAFLVMTGALELYTWACMMWVVHPWMRSTVTVTWENLVFTVLWVVLAPALAAALWGRIRWKLNPLFIVFPVYWAVYFFALGDPYAGLGWNTPWELAYEAAFDFAMLSGFFAGPRWRFWRR